MAEILGPMTILQRAFPTGVDGTRVGQWRMQRASVAFGELVTRMASALGSGNQLLLDKWGWLVNITEDDFFEYEDGGTVAPSPNITDVDNIDPHHADLMGHMLPLDAYGEAIGGSKRAFRDLRESSFRAAVRSNWRKLEWRFEQTALTRVFTDTENLLGTSGYDVGWVTSGGSAIWTPPGYDGQTFSGHSHYLGVTDSGTTLATQLNNLAETVQEHGHDGPYRAIVARADVNTYRNLTNFIQPTNDLISIIDRGGETTGPRYFGRIGMDMGVIGGFETDFGIVILHSTARVPTQYAWLGKSYGVNHPQNPIAVRVHPETGFGAYLVPETTQDVNYPIKQLNMEMEYGISVNMDRTNGAASFRDSGATWVDPTIS